MIHVCHHTQLSCDFHVTQLSHSCLWCLHKILFAGIHLSFMGVDGWVLRFSHHCNWRFLFLGCNAALLVMWFQVFHRNVLHSLAWVQWSMLPRRWGQYVPSKHLHSYTTQYSSRHKSFIKVVFACFMNKDNLKECLWNEKYTTLQKNWGHKRSRNMSQDLNYMGGNSNATSEKRQEYSSLFAKLCT